MTVSGTSESCKQGCYCIWPPLKTHSTLLQLQQHLKMNVIYVRIGVATEVKQGKKQGFCMLTMAEKNKRITQVECQVLYFLFSTHVLVVQLVVAFLSSLQGMFSLPLMLVFWSIHIISYFSIVSSWDIHEGTVSFIRYDPFLHLFVLCLVMYTVCPTVQI